jgi:AraC-like DNA-binding protein
MVSAGNLKYSEDRVMADPKLSLSERSSFVIRPNAKNRTKWSGKVYLWDDEGLFVGRPGDTDFHESPAIKICVSLYGEFLVIDEGANERNVISAVIPAGAFHSIRGNGSEMAMILLAPEGRLGQKFGGLRDINGFPVLDGLEDEIREVVSARDEFEDNSAIERVVKITSAHISERFGIRNAAEMDPRIAQSIEWIRRSRENGISIRDLAAEFRLSESRFSHLFSENLRVPVKRYLSWLRLRDAIHLISSLPNLTEAAHSAGFADSSHLTRTFRSALGIAPSDLVRHSDVISFIR